MIYYRILVEAHESAATIYAAGFLAEAAADQIESTVADLDNAMRVIRFDMRAVDLIDPSSFVRIARTFNRWREERSGRVTIEFPLRSLRRGPRRLELVDQRNTIGIAVNSAMTSPMSTSPG